VSAPLKAAWGLTAFVIVAGIVGWLVTDRAIFAVFLVLGVLTAVGAVVTGRAEKAAARRTAPEEGPTP
jgi:dolichol kinase